MKKNALTQTLNSKLKEIKLVDTVANEHRMSELFLFMQKPDSNS